MFFLVFINNKQNNICEQLRLYADDTIIFITDKNPQIIKQKAEQCMNSITEWLNVNSYILSDEKTNFSIFMPHTIKTPDSLNSINVNGKLVQRTTSSRDRTL